MNVFRLRDQLVGQYSRYVRSFIQIRDQRISDHVTQRLDEGMLWPEPLIQLNPSFEPGAWIDDLVLKQACVQRARLTSEFFPILAGEISPRLIEICSAGLKFVPAG